MLDWIVPEAPVELWSSAVAFVWPAARAHWPDRLPLETKRLDLPTLAKLTFFEPDFNKFRCLALAFEAGHRGGIVPAMMYAANEVLMDAFLKGNLKFTDIPKHVETIMAGAPTVMGHLSLDQVLEADAEDRRLTAALIK